MALRRRTRVWLKLVLWLGALVPLGLLGWVTYTGELLETEPVKNIQHRTGLAALILLFCTLAITPLRRATGWNDLIRFRRPLGLFAFFYATLHAFSYFVFDQQMSPVGIAKDVAEHPWVLVGFSAFVLLIPLAFTSTTASIRRLGGRRWQRVHQLIYVTAALGVLHFLWLVKKDERTPVLYALVLVGLLGLRLVPLDRFRRWWSREAGLRNREPGHTTPIADA